MGYTRGYRNENTQAAPGQVGLLAASTFVADWCCQHRWEKSTIKDAPKGQQQCQDCGAYCERDRRGMIIEYFRPVKGFSDIKD